MDDIKTRLKDFLRATRMTREELASRSGVKKSQIDKWLSTVPMPSSRVKFFELIMKDCGYAASPEPSEIRLRIHPERFRQIQTEAELHGLSVSEWADAVLEAHASIPCKKGRI